MTLREVISSPHTATEDQVKAAAVFAELGSGYVAEAADVLQQVIANPASAIRGRATASYLAKLGVGFVGAAAAVLRQIVTLPSTTPSDQVTAIGYLAELGAGHAEQVSTFFPRFGNCRRKKDDRWSIPRD